MELSPDTLEFLKGLPLPVITAIAIYGLWRYVLRPFLDMQTSAMVSIVDQAERVATMTEASMTKVSEFQEKQIEGLQKMLAETEARLTQQIKALETRIEELIAENHGKDKQIEKRDREIAALKEELAKLKAELLALQRLKESDA